MSFPDRPVAQLLGSNGPVHAVTYSAGSGSYILTGSADRNIRLYNPQPTTGVHSSGFITRHTDATLSPSQALPSGRLVQTYAEHGYEVLSLACASDNARFVSAGGDRTVFLWDVSTGQTLRRFSGHTGRVNAVCFSGSGSGADDDSLVVSGGFDTTVRIWDTRSGGSASSFVGKSVQTLSDARDAISAVAVRGPEILAASVDGRVRTYDVRAGRLVTDVVSGTAGLTSLCLTRDGRSMLVGSLDSRVRLFDRENGTCLRTYGGDEHEHERKQRERGRDERPVWVNEQLRIQSVLGGSERFVVAGDEMSGTATGDGTAEMPSPSSLPDGRVWAWDLLTGKVAATVCVPWGPPGTTNMSRAIGRDGREKVRRNVTNCLAWQDGGWGAHFCVGGTSGVVTVFGPK